MWVYGTVYPGASGERPTIVSADIFLDVSVNAKPVATFTAPTVTQQENSILFWDSGPLAFTHYSLYINITSASDNNPFAFDYLTYSTQASSSQAKPFTIDTSQAQTASLTNALSLTQASPTQSTSSSTGTTSETSPTSPAASQTDLAGHRQELGSSASKKHVGAVVGGVMAGIALATIILLFWW